MKRFDTEARQEFGDLHKLLKKTFPEYRTERDNVFDVKRFAADLGLTSEAVYKWLRNDRLPGRRAKQIVALADARPVKKGNPPHPKVTLEDFLPFLD